MRSKQKTYEYEVKKTPLNGYKIIRYTLLDGVILKKVTIKKGIKKITSAEALVYQLERNIKQ